MLKRLVEDCLQVLLRVLLLRVLVDERLLQLSEDVLESSDLGKCARNTGATLVTTAPANPTTHDQFIGSGC